MPSSYILQTSVSVELYSFYDLGWLENRDFSMKYMAFETWGYRNMFNITWLEKQKNEELLRRTGEDRSFIEQLEEETLS